MATKGTMRSIKFNIVSMPLVLLSSKLNTLQESTDRARVYINTVLFLKMSKIMIYMILFTLLSF